MLGFQTKEVIWLAVALPSLVRYFRAQEALYLQQPSVFRYRSSGSRGVELGQHTRGVSGRDGSRTPGCPDSYSQVP